jgi:hypothetical protein
LTTKKAKEFEEKGLEYVSKIFKEYHSYKEAFNKEDPGAAEIFSRLVAPRRRICLSSARTRLKIAIRLGV